MPEPGHDAAFLRLAFEDAAKEWAAIFEGRTGILRNWLASKEDRHAMEIWQKMYERIRDSEAGLCVLQEIACLRQQVEKLEAEVCRLSAAKTPPPEYHRLQVR